MTLARGNATLRKIHDDSAKRTCRNEGDKWWLQAPSFFFLSYFQYTMYFGTTTQYYTSTQQYNHNVFLHTHTLYKLVGAAPPQHAANTFGGGGVPKKIASSLHGITWCDAGPRPVSASERSILVKHIFAGLTD
jgi:hypothetical protein